MIITKELKCKEEYLPSPRHRKMRYREVTGEFNACIAEITAAQAPVVLKVHDLVNWAEGYHAVEYRWYNEYLYTLARRGFFFNCPAEEEGFGITVSELADVLSVGCNYEMSATTVAEAFQSESDKWLIIDGMAWQKSAEPFYEICTFGLGNNHGSTALHIEKRLHRTRGEYAFSALQEKEAREKAVEIALDRGDTQYVKCIQDRRSRIEVLDPSVIRFQRDKRIFLLEKSVTRHIHVKACSYAEALRLAKQIPDELFSEGHVSYHYPAEEVTEEEWTATGRPCYDDAAVAAFTENEVSENAD